MYHLIWLISPWLIFGPLGLFKTINQSINQLYSHSVNQSIFFIKSLVLARKNGENMPLCFFCFLLCLHPDLARSKTLWSLLHKILFSAFPRCYIYLANRLWEQSSLSAGRCQLDVTPNSPFWFIRKCAEVKRLKRHVFPNFPC